MSTNNAEIISETVNNITKIVEQEVCDQIPEIVKVKSEEIFDKIIGILTEKRNELREDMIKEFKKTINEQIMNDVEIKKMITSILIEGTNSILEIKGLEKKGGKRSRKNQKK